MEATLLNTNLEPVAIIDKYISFIWTERYDEAGDFEMRMRMYNSLPNEVPKGYYLWIPGSDRLMIIDSVGIKSDDNEGASFIIKGKSLESILQRRIIWNQTNFNLDDEANECNLQNGIKQLLEENVINPAISARKIDNFIFEESDDPRITELTFEAQYLGDELYTVINNLCRENEIGFKVTLNSNNQFVFKLYAGEDRSYAQDTNPYVIFSPGYDNISNTNYVNSDESLKNVTLVLGEGTYNEETGEDSRIRHIVENVGYHVGLDRREIFTDATSLKMKKDDGGVYTAEEYEAHLNQKGYDTLIANTSSIAFDGSLDQHNTLYVYGEDYFIGDIVQFTNEYGQEGQARITEYIRACDSNGISVYPTFTIIQKGVYEE